MNIEKELKRELKRKSDEMSANKKSEQIEAFQKLKEKIDQAGYLYGDKYQTPLMHRLGLTLSE
ncbi:MAG: hypothetical protein LBE62_13185 [Azonexus sp.]|jgi:hypothetical protein|nr:hypothetical protein [Azonexus sp.]